MFTLSLREPLATPCDFEGLLPERLQMLTLDELHHLPILHGNRRNELGLFCRIDSHPGPVSELRLIGDFRNVHGIGRGMTSGAIVVDGNAGRHAGAEMQGGRLTITGTAGDWLGAEMHGGTVEVHGAVGHGAGAGYRGSRHGMTGGCIWLQASAGDELGSQMRRGLIVAEGRVGAFAGANLIAGTIVLLSGAGHQLGAGMKRGTILACGPAQPSAGFRFSCDFAPQILPLLAKTVRNLGCQAFPDPPPMTVQCHRGDVLTGGKGEIWIPGRE